MQPVEEGLLTLNSRASTFIPSFERSTIAAANDRGRAVVRPMPTV
jgi:hypothetical protein